MAKEIERKFLIKNDTYKNIGIPQYYKQGYICDDPSRTVRVRIVGDKGVLTIKGISMGNSRDEFEYEIPLDDAKQLLDNLSKKPLIEKNRYKINYKNFLWEIDEFFGENEGLTIAEIELTSETQTFEIPNWIGEEVTGDIRYYNSNLFKNPFSKW